MRILFLISSEGFYGVENMLLTLARQLSEHGCSSVIGVFSNLHCQYLEVAEKAQAQGLEVELIPCAGKWDRSAVLHIRKLVQKHGIDIVHSHGYKTDFYGYAAARGLRVGLMATSHNWTGKTPLMRIYEMLDRLVLRNFQKVIVVSDDVAARLRRWGVSANRISRICNGVDIQRYEEATPALRRELRLGRGPVVGFVGRLVPDKGGAVLIRAARRVLDSCPDARFVFVGDGPARSDWELLVRDHGIAEKVFFTGAREDIPAVYASLDILVLPSFLEAFPMCLLEGMASGIPVIASRVGAIPTLIDHESTGLLVEPRDVDGLASEILRLLHDPMLANRIAEKGQAHVRKHFSSSHMAKNYIHEYQQLQGLQARKSLRQVEWRTN